MTEEATRGFFPLQRLTTLDRGYGQERVYGDKVCTLNHTFGVHNEKIPLFGRVEALCEFIADFAQRTTCRGDVAFVCEETPHAFGHLRDLALRENRLVYLQTTRPTRLLSRATREVTY